MTWEIEHTLLVRLNDHLANHIGLSFAPGQFTDFRGKIKAASKEFGMEPLDCINWLLSSPLTEEQIHTLSFHLTIGETYFFREARVFEALEDEVLFNLIRQRRSTTKYLRIWSAGCCTGEEPYSVAMLLTRILPDIESWRISILGTDINPQFLKKAQRGIYEPWSFRVTPPAMKERFFTHTNGKYLIAPAIKQMVRFAQMNLVDPNVPHGLLLSSFDIILCRNVIMYFNREQAARLSIRLHESLADRGVLVSTPFEISTLPDTLFERLPYKAAVLLRKRSNLLAHSNEDAISVSPASMPTSSKSTSLIPTSSISTSLVPTSSISTSLIPIPSKQISLIPILSKPTSSLPHAAPAASAPLTSPERIPKPIAEDDVFRQATLLMDADLHADCISLLVPLCSGPTSNAELSYILSHAYSNQGSLTEALHWVDKSLEINKLNHLAYFTRASILQAQGKVNEALASLRQAVFLEPEFVVAEFQMGSLLLQIGKLEESRRRFRGALMLLSQYNGDDLVPQGAGMTVSVLSQIIESLLNETSKQLSGG
jgi:chemotaxis protein methyltransferase CheR